MQSPCELPLLLRVVVAKNSCVDDDDDDDDPLTALPDHVLVSVLRQLDLRSLVAVSQTCHKLRGLARSNERGDPSEIDRFAKEVRAVRHDQEEQRTLSAFGARAWDWAHIAVITLAISLAFLRLSGVCRVPWLITLAPLVLPFAHAAAFAVAASHARPRALANALEDGAQVPEPRAGCSLQPLCCLATAALAHGCAPPRLAACLLAAPLAAAAAAALALASAPAWALPLPLHAVSLSFLPLCPSGRPRLVVGCAAAALASAFAALLSVRLAGWNLPWLTVLAPAAALQAVAAASPVAACPQRGLGEAVCWAALLLGAPLWAAELLAALKLDGILSLSWAAALAPAAGAWVLVLLLYACITARTLCDNDLAEDWCLDTDASESVEDDDEYATS
eukprot:TRINITY_DN3155_c0_g1_i2.p1 TRINITY_DN3155_c0_g1~~TRINITY_DN3155_c0_g1_i2.p1  ORF type:complete len:409 (+),score=115.83 TRINITY_DN3155_c0_g1_i2:54-1229(+)